MKQVFSQRMLWMGIAVLAVLLVANVLLLFLLPVRSTTAPAGPEKVDLQIITAPGCTECFNASQYRPELEGVGVSFGEVTTSELGTAAADRLIRKYGITKLPALLFSEELGSYPTVAQAWERVGTIAPDGSYLLAGTNPPYYDLESGSVKGLVEMILLDDASCEECYDPALHEQVLQRYGMGISSQRTVDLSSEEGQEFLSQYGITAVPTLLLRGEPGIYLGFDQVWQSVGLIAEDGTYVFTNLAALGLPYEDLATGKVVQPANDTGAPAQ